MLLRLLRAAAALVAVLLFGLIVGLVLGLVRGSVPSSLGQSPDCALTGPLLRYVVLFDAQTPEQSAARAIQAACGTSTAYYPQIGVGVAASTEPGFAVRFGLTRAYSAQAETLGRSRRAELATPVGSLTTARLPAATQALSADQSTQQWDMEMIHAPQARAINPGRADVLVGVLDSGVDGTHPDLLAALDPVRSAGCLSGKPDPSPAAWRPTTSGHGTHVAGTIAATENGRGITGVAPGVRVASVKVVDDDGFIYPEYAVCGLMWAAQQRMRIANSSYSLDPWLLICSDVLGQAVAYEALRRAVEYATAQGVLSIAAAGNERLNLADPQLRRIDRHCHVLPAELPGVVAVSAVGARGVKSEYSSYGRGVVTVTAPGGDRAQPVRPGVSGCVLSTVPGGYDYACGTSMATPHVSGVAALLASTRPGAGPQELASLLRQQAKPLPCPGPEDDPGAVCSPGPVTGFYGYGLVDALKAVSVRED